MSIKSRSEVYSIIKRVGESRDGCLQVNLHQDIDETIIIDCVYGGFLRMVKINNILYNFEITLSGVGEAIYEDIKS